MISGLRNIYDEGESRSIINILFKEFLGWSKTRVHLEGDSILATSDEERFMNALDRLVRGCPVQYITGQADFNGLSLTVDQSVLIPRPETAELAGIIEMDLKSFDLQGFSVLDIGTGSGCIPIYLKKRLPLAVINAVDISEEALAVARFNADLLDTEIRFIRADIFNPPESLMNSLFNLIVSNPPYVTLKEKQAMNRNVLEYEPHEALFVPDEDPLLFYRAIAEFAQFSLAQGGLLYLEINETFGPELTELLLDKGFYDPILRKDFRGRDRFIKAVFRSR